jgi:hypothetical protein
MSRTCDWCHASLQRDNAPQALTCSQRCRQAKWRFARECRARQAARRPLSLAYADPPYPGTAAKYYRHQHAFRGEVRIRRLLRKLSRFDGWALSTSARALPAILTAAVGLGVTVRVASWHRGARVSRSYSPLSSWEPVVYAGGRRQPSLTAARDTLDHVSRPRLTDPQRCVGSKPAAFAFWVFDLLGARPGDRLSDLYPGSGGISRAWRLLNSRRRPHPTRSHT